MIFRLIRLFDSFVNFVIFEDIVLVIFTKTIRKCNTLSRTKRPIRNKQYKMKLDLPEELLTNNKNNIREGNELFTIHPLISIIHGN